MYPAAARPVAAADPAAAELWFVGLEGEAWTRLLDAAQHPPRYEITVTGARRRVTAATPAAAASLLVAAAGHELPGPPTAGPPPPHPAPPPAPLGATVRVNGRSVAIFKYAGAPLAMDAACPHAGGELALGDIEEYGGHLCVTCPRHGFLFDAGTGAGVVPEGRPWRLGVYPVHLSPSRAAAEAWRAGGPAAEAAAVAAAAAAGGGERGAGPVLLLGFAALDRGLFADTDF